MPLITPDSKPNLLENRQIEDFPPVTLPEITAMMWNPILEALRKGIPADQPAAVPLEAMARMLHTIKLLSLGQAAAGNLLVEILQDEDTKDEIKDKINRLLSPDLFPPKRDEDEEA